jgi:hypothetical protein
MWRTRLLLLLGNGETVASAVVHGQLPRRHRWLVVIIGAVVVEWLVWFIEATKHLGLTLNLSL